LIGWFGGWLRLMANTSKKNPPYRGADGSVEDEGRQESEESCEEVNRCTLAKGL
jgi:hypothetical protein